MADSTDGTVVATIPQAASSAPAVTYSITLKQPPPADPHWTAYVTAISTPIVAMLAAVIAGGIAYKNWRTAQNKLKLDLYDRRVAIWDAMQAAGNLIFEVQNEARKGTIRKDSPQNFVTAIIAPQITKSRFLFPLEVHDFINEYFQRALEFDGARAGFNFHNHEGEKQEDIKKMANVLRWVNANGKRMTDLFEKNMRVDHN